MLLDVDPTVDDPLKLRGKNYIAKQLSPGQVMRCKPLSLRGFRFGPTGALGPIENPLLKTRSLAKRKMEADRE
jgi:hypothetical protein